MIWVKVKETPQQKDMYLPTSTISTKPVVSWFWAGVEFFLSVFEMVGIKESKDCVKKMFAMGILRNLRKGVSRNLKGLGHSGRGTLPHLGVLLTMVINHLQY